MKERRRGRMRECLIDGDGRIQCDYVIKTTVESWEECGRFGCDYKWNAYDSERGIKNTNKLQKRRKLLFLSDSFCLYFQMFNVIPSFYLCRFLFFSFSAVLYSPELSVSCLCSLISFPHPRSLSLIFCLSRSWSLSLSRLLSCSFSPSHLLSCSLSNQDTHPETSTKPCLNPRGFPVSIWRGSCIMPCTCRGSVCINPKGLPANPPTQQGQSLLEPQAALKGL